MEAGQHTMAVVVVSSSLPKAHLRMFCAGFGRKIEFFSASDLYGRWMDRNGIGFHVRKLQTDVATGYLKELIEVDQIIWTESKQASESHLSICITKQAFCRQRDFFECVILFGLEVKFIAKNSLLCVCQSK